MTSRHLVLAVVLGACAAPASTAPGGPPAPATERGDPNLGVLVMAHGGGAEWNRTVSDAVAPVAEELPTALAFGMADPATLTASLDSLRARGARRVAVVRMFLSGRSFLAETQYLLGLDAGRGGHPTAGERGPGVGMTSMHGALHPIDHGLEVATHDDGMLSSVEAERILTERARELSASPAEESVLLIAHGMGDEAENDQVLAALERVAEAVRSAGFHAVWTATLREDWPEERADAERAIRAFVERETAAGRRVLVVPARLSGFGPYADVLTGLEYRPGEGLLPHEEISGWIRGTAERIACSQGWRNGLGSC